MIPIKNIYYMLAYAFGFLREQGYRDMETESFDNTSELCAAILVRGVTSQLKRGFVREYIPHTDSLSTLRGKIDMTESVKTLSFLRRQLICSYDEFSVNSYANRIIKSTMMLLLRSGIKKSRRQELRRLLVFFGDVETLDLRSVNWNFRNRNSKTYRMLIAICRLVAEGLLQTQEDGTTRLMDFLDETRMHKLYERFILEYYRREYPQIKTSSSRIKWSLDDDNDDKLPVMQADVMLTHKEKTLIIDAKYYAKTMQSHYNKHTIHSVNLYQIFTYVKNKKAELTHHEVSGMLLYAKTDEEIYPENEYMMSGSKIIVRTLDLNCGFEAIREQLDGIARLMLQP